MINNLLLYFIIKLSIYNIFICKKKRFNSKKIKKEISEIYFHTIIDQLIYYVDRIIWSFTLQQSFFNSHIIDLFFFFFLHPPAIVDVLTTYTRYRVLQPARVERLPYASDFRWSFIISVNFATSVIIRGKMYRKKTATFCLQFCCYISIFHIEFLRIEGCTNL